MLQVKFTRLITLIDPQDANKLLMQNANAYLPQVVSCMLDAVKFMVTLCRR